VPKHSLTSEILPAPFEWCEIPQGFVTLIDARNQGGTSGGKFEVQGFTIAKYPITNAQYQIFIDAADGYRDARWWNFSKEAAGWRMLRPQPTDAAFSGGDLPRTNISWYDAIAFTRWLSYRTGRQIALPTEQQWQRAAQGDDQREYSWGNTFDHSCCNLSGKKGKLMPVTRSATGVSPFQVMDMVGNANEWCLTAWSTDNTQLAGKDERVLRGGCWLDSTAEIYVTTRKHDKPSSERTTNGFRIVRAG
jgi:formylglycine-generating enzyme required for sulfatase activity